MRYMTMRQIDDEISKNKKFGPPSDFRIVPKNLYNSVKENYENTLDTLAAFKHVYNAFRIYRNSVNEMFFAPHIYNDGFYEWPKPKDISWSDSKKVTELGEAIDPHYINSFLRIETPDGNDISSRVIIPGGDDVIGTRAVGKYDHMGMTFLYEVDDSIKFSVLFSDMWQNDSLASFAQFAGRSISEIESGSRTPRDFDGVMLNYISHLASLHRRY